MHPKTPPHVAPCVLSLLRHAREPAFGDVVIIFHRSAEPLCLCISSSTSAGSTTTTIIISTTSNSVLDVVCSCVSCVYPRA